MTQKYENIFSLLEKTTYENQKKVALGMKNLWGWNEFTYKGLSLLAERLGSYLINDLQIPKGEKLAILSESLPEYGVFGKRALLPHLRHARLQHLRR